MSQSEPQSPEPLEVTFEEGQQAMKAHAREKGYRLHLKYPKLNEQSIYDVLKDETFVRYPTVVIFDSAKVADGYFAVTEKRFDDEKPHYVIYVHKLIQTMPEKLASLVLYHLVTVNYGEFASDEAALEFGSSALNCDKEVYYKTLCDLVDGMEGAEKGTPTSHDQPKK